MDKHASHQKLALLAGMLIGAAGAALAQQAPPNDAAKMIKGTVAQYSLMPGGDVDGLILNRDILAASLLNPARVLRSPRRRCDNPGVEGRRDADGGRRIGHQ